MVTGGRSATRVKTDTSEVYDGIDWKVIAGKLPTPVITPGLINIGSKILVIGQLNFRHFKVLERGQIELVIISLSLLLLFLAPSGAEGMLIFVC